MTDEPQLCALCRRPLGRPGYGYDPVHQLWVHVGCYHEWVTRHGLASAPLEQLRWWVGERVSVVVDGETHAGEIVSVGGGGVQVRLVDQMVTVAPGQVRPARW
jgi:hypothetical protein